MQRELQQVFRCPPPLDPVQSHAVVYCMRVLDPRAVLPCQELLAVHLGATTSASSCQHLSDLWLQHSADKPVCPATCRCSQRCRAA